MFDYVHLFLIFTMPILLTGLKTFHQGLITGLFLSLLYFGSLVPPLTLVPLSAAVCLRFFQIHPQTPSQPNPFYVRKPSRRLFLAFLTVMVIFCAFGDAIFLYGTYIKASGAALRFSGFLGFLGLLSGPISVGFWCDRRGPFESAVLLCLLAETGIALAAAGDSAPMLWAFGWFVQQLVISGFLTLVPLISHAIIGHSHFLKLYPEMAIVLMLTWAGADYMYSRSPGFTENPGDLLMTLVFLPLLAVFFIVIAWQKRFVLVREQAPEALVGKK